MKNPTRVEGDEGIKQSVPAVVRPGEKAGERMLRADSAQCRPTIEKHGGSRPAQRRWRT